MDFIWRCLNVNKINSNYQDTKLLYLELRHKLKRFLYLRNRIILLKAIILQQPAKR